MEFPTLFYRTPGTHRLTGDTTYDYIAVVDDDDAIAKLEAGWSETLEDAVGLVKADDAVEAADDLHDALEDVDPAAREALQAEAKELGVSFNWKTGNKALAERIAAKRAEA